MAPSYGFIPLCQIFNITMSKFTKLDGQEMVVESTLQDMQAVEENTIIETIKNAEWLMPGLAAAVVIGGVNVNLLKVILAIIRKKKK